MKNVATNTMSPGDIGQPTVTNPRRSARIAEKKLVAKPIDLSAAKKGAKCGVQKRAPAAKQRAEDGQSSVPARRRRKLMITVEQLAEALEETTLNETDKAILLAAHAAKIRKLTDQFADASLNEPGDIVGGGAVGEKAGATDINAMQGLEYANGNSLSSPPATHAAEDIHPQQTTPAPTNNPQPEAHTSQVAEAAKGEEAPKVKKPFGGIMGAKNRALRLREEANPTPKPWFYNPERTRIGGMPAKTLTPDDTASIAASLHKALKESRKGSKMKVRGITMGGVKRQAPAPKTVRKLGVISGEGLL